jgi:radical SAM protein with 4Fe4S-binding SPASM domain
MNKLFRLGITDLRFSIHALISDKYASVMGTSLDNYMKAIYNIAYAIEHKNDTKIVITAVIIKENKDQIQLLIDNYAKQADLLEIWKPHNWVDADCYRLGDLTKRTCGRPSKGPLQIQVDGTINMCCFDYNGQLLLGNFKKQTLKEIFSSEPYLTIKKHHKNGTIQKSDLLCKECDQLYENKDVLIYNSQFDKEDRIGKLSTTYRRVK